MWHVDALSKLKVADIAAEKLPELKQCFWFVRKEVRTVLRIFGDPNGAIADAIVDEVATDVEQFGDMVGPEESGDDARMSLGVTMEDSVLAPNRDHHRRDHYGAFRRSMASGG